jgi:hypothetical protein
VAFRPGRSPEQGLPLQAIHAGRWYGQTMNSRAAVAKGPRMSMRARVLAAAAVAVVSLCSQAAVVGTAGVAALPATGLYVIAIGGNDVRDIAQAVATGASPATIATAAAA